MSTALVLVGRDRYGDPWHDHAACADAVAQVLRRCDVVPHLRSVFPTTWEDPVAARADLIVVLAGARAADAADATDAATTADAAEDDVWAPFHAGLADRVRAGTPLLALHSSAMAFPDAPDWAALVGGRWVPDVTWHPPHGPTTVRPVREDHPVTSGLGPVTAPDELYCDLEVSPASTVLLAGEHDGAQQPVVWQAPGPGRVIYDALGHDVRSYAAPPRRELLVREVRWLLGSASTP